MKKIFLMALLCLGASCVQAQETNWDKAFDEAMAKAAERAEKLKTTIWYGVSLSNVAMTGTTPKSVTKFINFGFLQDFVVDDDFAIGIGWSVQTKGFKKWDPWYGEFSLYGDWHLIYEDDYSVSLSTGPFLGYMMGKDDAVGVKKWDFGWDAGVKGTYKKFSLKLGYEYSFTDCFKGGKSKPHDLYVRLGYNF